MFFIWGWNTRCIGENETNYSCSHCGYEEMTLVFMQKYFEVFFIPLIPLGKSEYLICSQCETQFKVESIGAKLDQ